MSRVKRLGLIVNPLAGIGGPAGLKGSDGEDVQALALERGVRPMSAERAAQTLAALKQNNGLEGLQVLVGPGDMGATSATLAKVEVEVVGTPTPARTSADDTKRVARKMKERGVDLLLFAGGDGTARDIFDAVGPDVPVLGIPSGVKIQSPVFALHPLIAARIAAGHLREKGRPLTHAEVIDLDESSLRDGEVTTCLYGYLLVPEATSGRQGRKSGTPASDTRAQHEIAARIADIADNHLFLIGPGSTTLVVKEALAGGGTLLGVDVIENGRLILADASEQDLLTVLPETGAHVIVSPIGGQGYVLGRGNQQISRLVLERIGYGNLMVIATPGKLASLGGRPLLVDTGDTTLDVRLSGFVRVITGRYDEAIYPLRAASFG